MIKRTVEVVDTNLMNELNSVNSLPITLKNELVKTIFYGDKKSDNGFTLEIPTSTNSTTWVSTLLRY